MPNDLPPELHSAAYFGEQRDFWWNADFLALVVQRLGVASAGRVLDVGCGVGHWGRVLLPHLPAAIIAGVDREPAWVDEAARRARAAGLSDRLTYGVGVAEALPFPDATFDLVTCQTVLIHVPDVPRVLAELLRVLRPGGTLLCAEPNNLGSAFIHGFPGVTALLDDKLDVLRLQACCEAGKVALGEGDNSVGELLPGHFRAAGLEKVRVWLSDKATTLLPPYASPAEAAVRDDLLEMDANGFAGWSRADTERYYRASGAPPEAFETLWQKARAAHGAEAAALRAGTFHCAGGGLQYVVAGVRRASL